MINGFFINHILQVHRFQNRFTGCLFIRFYPESHELTPTGRSSGSLRFLQPSHPCVAPGQ